jgi:hypothetical protein
MTVAAYQQPPQPQPSKQKVRDNLYMLVGGGGNTGVFISANGVTVIDTKNPATERDSQQIKTTPKPAVIINTLRMVITSATLSSATVDVVTQENTAANMKLMKPVPGSPKRSADEHL